MLWRIPAVCTGLGNTRCASQQLPARKTQPQTLPLCAASSPDALAGADTVLPLAEGAFLVILLQHQTHFLTYEMHLRKDVMGSQAADSVS